MNDVKLDLPYFKAPLSDTLLYPGASPEMRKCFCCQKECENTFFVKESRGLLGRKSKYGCLDCLLKRKYSLSQPTQMGLVENGVPELRAPSGFSKQALIDIGFSPPIATYQDYCYLLHCKDFMTYIGRWNPRDFDKNAKNGDGRALWIAAGGEEFLWDQTMEDMEEYGDDWPQYKLSDWSDGAGVYVFKCRHCDKLECYWDCD